MKKILLLALLSLSLAPQSFAKIKVACIGDSVTYGYLLENRGRDSYPSQLAALLGEGYEVRNFGHNGATLLRKGHRPYDQLPEMRAALSYAPDIAVIHLGLNDTDPRNWPNWAEDFIPDYRALIDSLRSVNRQMRILVCRPSPIFEGHPRFLSGTRDWHRAICKAIETVALGSGCALVDLTSPLACRPDLFPDSLHPSPEGAGIIAKEVYGAISGDFGGLRLSPLLSDNMVLQRDKPLRLRGRADAFQKIEVSLRGSEGVLAEGSASSGADGWWELELPAQAAGGPFSLQVADRVFSNVWIGEVWLCSGQSNMAFPLEASKGGAEAAAQAGESGTLHLFDMQERWPTDNYAWPQEALEAVNRLEYFSSRGWEPAGPSNAGRFSAVGYYFGKALADSLGCHIGLISCACGGSTMEAWTDRQLLAWEYPQILLGRWTEGDFGQPWARGRALANTRNAASKLQRHPYEPGYLFDAGLRQLGRYGIKGILWYQGESNAHNIELYEDLFRLGVKSWRRLWGEELPVLLVQLSGIERPSWGRMRNAQRLLAEELPGVYLSVSHDLGDPKDVHPKDKAPVGLRAALSALFNVYGRWGLTPCGPVPRSCAREGSSLRLFFDFAEGLKAGAGFELAGEDGVYYPAQARVEDACVLLESPLVSEPVAARYAWKPWPSGALLENSAGLPASTFSCRLAAGENMPLPLAGTP